MGPRPRLKPESANTPPSGTGSPRASPIGTGPPRANRGLARRHPARYLVAARARGWHSGGVSQLLRGKQKGRFGAPPEPTAKIQWWRPIPIYLLLPATVVFLVIGGTEWLTYESCRSNNSFCGTTKLHPIASGTYNGMLVATGFLLAVAIVGMVLAPAMLKRWPFWLCWLIALVAAFSAVFVFLVMSASVSTPFGGLGPFPPIPTVAPR